MGKKVKVTTKCGEEHFYEYDQDVESVTIIESTTQKRTTLKAIAAALREFVNKHHEWTVFVHLVDHDKEGLCDGQERGLLITLEDGTDQEIMNLINGES